MVQQILARAAPGATLNYETVSADLGAATAATITVKDEAGTIVFGPTAGGAGTCLTQNGNIWVWDPAHATVLASLQLSLFINARFRVIFTETAPGAAIVEREIEVNGPAYQAALYPTPTIYIDGGAAASSLGGVAEFGWGASDNPVNLLSEAQTMLQMIPAVEYSCKGTIRENSATIPAQIALVKGEPEATFVPNSTYSMNRQKLVNMSGQGWGGPSSTFSGIFAMDGGSLKSTPRFTGSDFGFEGGCELSGSIAAVGWNWGGEIRANDLILDVSGLGSSPLNQTWIVLSGKMRITNIPSGATITVNYPFGGVLEIDATNLAAHTFEISGFVQVTDQLGNPWDGVSNIGGATIVDARGAAKADVDAVIARGDAAWIAATGFSTAADVVAARDAVLARGDAAWVTGVTATGFSTPADVVAARDAVLARGDAAWVTGSPATGFSTAADVNAARDAVLAAITALNDPTASSIAAAVMAFDVTTGATANTFQQLLQVLVGALFGNYLLDGGPGSGDMLPDAQDHIPTKRARIFAPGTDMTTKTKGAANRPASGHEGEIARIDFASVPVSGKPYPAWMRSGLTLL